MVNLVSLYLLRSFSLTVFVKIFLIQNSSLIQKPSTNLNQKEGKQEKATIDKSATIYDSWGNIYRV